MEATPTVRSQGKPRPEISLDRRLISDMGRVNLGPGRRDCYQGTSQPFRTCARKSQASDESIRTFPRNCANAMLAGLPYLSINIRTWQRCQPRNAPLAILGRKEIFFAPRPSVRLISHPVLLSDSDGFSAGSPQLFLPDQAGAVGAISV